MLNAKITWKSGCGGGFFPNPALWLTYYLNHLSYPAAFLIIIIHCYSLCCWWCEGLAQLKIIVWFQHSFIKLCNQIRVKIHIRVGTKYVTVAYTDDSKRTLKVTMFLSFRRQSKCQKLQLTLMRNLETILVYEMSCLCKKGKFLASICLYLTVCETSMILLC